MPDAVGDYDLVTAQLQFEFLALRLGDMGRRPAIAIARVEHIALGAIEALPGSAEYMFAHAPHQLHVEVNVVQTQQLPPLRFAYSIEMIEIGDRIGPAGMAMALRVEGPLPVSIGSTPQIPTTHTGECHALFRKRRWQYAVKHVDTPVHGLEQIPRSSHAHEIAGTIRRQEFGDDGRALLALGATFSHGEAADREAVERHLGDCARAGRAQVRITCSLHNTEQRLWRFTARRKAAKRPSVR